MKIPANIQLFDNVGTKQTSLQGVRDMLDQGRKPQAISTWRMKEKIGVSKTVTKTPSIVLVMNKYKRLPKKCKAVLRSIWLRSKLWIALKRTTDVASFTTPSPNTRL